MMKPAFRPGRMSPMARRLTALGVATLGLAAISGAAQAQVFGWGGGYRVYRERPYVIEPPYAVERAPSLDVRGMLVEDGYKVVGRIQRKGPVFIADVIDLRGRAARLIVDAEDGSILDRFDGIGPRPPRDIASVAPGDDLIETGPPAPKVVPGIGPDKRAGQPLGPRAALASREPGKAPAIAKPKAPGPEKKPLASESMKPPAKQAEKPVPAPAPVAAVKPSAPRVIAPETLGSGPKQKIAPPSPPAPAAAQDPGGFANGVPVNPLD